MPSSLNYNLFNEIILKEKASSPQEEDAEIFTHIKEKKLPKAIWENL